MSITYNFNNDAVNSTTSSGFSVISSNEIQILKFGVLANSSIDASSTSSTTLRLSISGSGVSYSNTISLTKGGDPEYVEFETNITIPENSTVTFSLSRTRAYTYGTTGASQSYFYGAKATINFNCYIEVGSDNAPWEITGNFDYPTLTANERNDFVDWAIDENDYPLNPGVWRIDGNNSGYPWIWGFGGIAPVKQTNIYIKTENSGVSQWQAIYPFMFVDNGGVKDIKSLSVYVFQGEMEN